QQRLSRELPRRRGGADRSGGQDVHAQRCGHQQRRRPALGRRSGPNREHELQRVLAQRPRHRLWRDRMHHHHRSWHAARDGVRHVSADVDVSDGGRLQDGPRQHDHCGAMIGMKTVTSTTLRIQGGFTLAELMVACAIVGIVLAGTFVAMKQGANAYEYTTGRVEVQETGRVALDRMIHDLRSGSNVSAATATSITFQYIDEALATITVTYSLNGADILRNQTNPVAAAPQPETLAGGVNTFSLVYYDSNN